MSVQDLSPLIRRIPKVELHVHLEGSISPQLANRLAARNNVELPAGVGTAYTFDSIGDFIRLYIALSRCLVDVEDFQHATVDLARRLAEQNVRYAEVTFTPMTHASRGVSVETMRDGLLEGRRRAHEHHQVELAFVFDMVRTLREQAAPTVDFAEFVRRTDEHAVIALGVGGPELGDPPSPELVDAFARARAGGLKSLPHAGEQAGAHSIWSALRDLKADRIGHGVRCLEDPKLVEHLRENEVFLEVCPTSNVALGVFESVQAHPLPRLLEEGLRVTLASDDPALFSTNLVAEYERCADAFGWSAGDVAAIAAAGIDAAYCSGEIKSALRAEQEEATGRPLV